jgi:hypothetical protein
MIFGPEKCASISNQFEEKQESLTQLFTEMRRTEFLTFVGFCFSRLHRVNKEKNPLEFIRVRGLLLAIARKELEISDFEDDITPDQRTAYRNTATLYYELAKGCYPPDQQDAVEAAWRAAMSYGERFGYRKKIIFDIFAPHRVFRG